MKQMSLIEMDGFLKGKCIPSDLKVNETNAEYLVRKFAEAEAKISALSEDQQRAIESIKQADAAVKLAHEKFSALAAENAVMKAFGDKLYSMYKGLEASGGGFHDEQSIPYQQAALDAAISEFEKIKPRRPMRSWLNCWRMVWSCLLKARRNTSEKTATNWIP